MSDNADHKETELNLPNESGIQKSPLELTNKGSSHTTHDTEAPSKMVIENEPSKYAYPVQMTNPFERENWTVSTDHCYARPWNWRPESTFLKPTKTLFIPKSTSSGLFDRLGSPKKTDDEIDVESIVETPAPVYDLTNAKALMDECRNQASMARKQSEEDWEEKISKTNWSPSQHRLFNGFANILNSYCLSKLAMTDVSNEPILRRTVIDKAVQRVRRLFATVSLDTKLLQWLHQLLIDSLDQDYLALYLDILQSLKGKIPSFVEKMMYSTNGNARLGALSNENLFSLLKKPWDPVASSLMQDKPKKLPGSPVLVLVPSSPMASKRTHKWMSLLTHLGHAVTVPTNFGTSGHRMTLTSCADQMFSLTRGRVQEIRENFPGKHIILVGIGAGATLAVQVAQVENVLCVVSLGFSLLTAEGRRGEIDDNLMELQCPVLFVIGQCSSTSFQEDLEDLRERMRVETGLIVVGSADNNLIINKKKKREEGITQSIVNRCIIDEVGEFISSLILSPFPPQIRQSPTTIATEATSKKAKNERKRYNSNTSSVDSEPPSPTPRLSRPVGRPAGSKTKSRLESKWAAQVAQGTASSSVHQSNGPVSTNPPPSPGTPPLPTSIVSHDATPNSSSDTISAPEASTPSPLKTNPAKKMKTLKPAPEKIRTLKSAAEKMKTFKHEKTKTVKPTSAEWVVKKGTTQQGGVEQARLQAYNLNRNVAPGGQLSTLLQGGIKTIPPIQSKPSSTIKVLENVQLTSQATAKLITTASGRTIDFSKLSLASGGGNVVLLPDGKIKTIHTTGGTSGLRGNGGTRFMTSKKQLTAIKAGKPVKRHSYVPVSGTAQITLPPPTNLTSQDIMDLPIIFADDNQIIDSNLPTDLSTSGASQQPTKFVSAPLSKFVIVTKPNPTSIANFIVTPTSVKRPNPVSITKQPTKYTKIILSKKTNDDSVKLNTVRVPSEVITVDHIDLEAELVATAVPKPNLPSSDVRNITILPKTILADTFKRIEDIGKEDDDPDYVPPKNLKLI